MKKLLRFFGYIPVSDLLSAVMEYNKEQSTLAKKIMDKEIATENFNKGLEEGWKGIGASDFVIKYWEK